MIAATAKTQSEASMTCAALRDRASPVLTSASPTPARGTNRIRTTQSVAEASERKGGAANPLSFWNQMGASHETQSHQLHGHPSQHECSAHPQRWQQRQRGDNNPPSRKQ